MRQALLALFLLTAVSQIQGQMVAPTSEPVGPVRGDEWNGYNIVNSFETGYRFVDISGNQNKYRSDENFGNGIRLLSGSFGMNSKSGTAKYFDELLVNVNGLGGDPYESATLRLDKNRFYQYDLSWRKNDYFNPGLTTDGANGQHLLDTTYKLQDHNLTLLPRSWIRFTLGYTHSEQAGAGISTVQLYGLTGAFDNTGQIYPVFANVKRQQNDFRLGGEVHLLGFTLNWLRGWEDFKDDTPLSFSGSVLDSFSRVQPNHGTSPYWQVGLFRDARWISLNSRFTYTTGRRAFLSTENALGTNQLGALSNQQILSAGNASRPVTTGNLNVNIFPSPNFQIATHTSVYNVRTKGDSAYIQYDNATLSTDVLYYQYLGIRTIESGVDLQYQAKKWLEFSGGYEYSDRRINSTSQFGRLTATPLAVFSQTSILNSGLFGVKLRPVKGLTILLRGETGLANHPFTPRSDNNYHALSGRIDYKWKTLRLSAQSKSDYNVNSITFSSYSAHARAYSGTLTYTPNAWFSLDGTVSKTHVDSLGGIAFFANAQLFPNQVSYYVSNLYAANFLAHFTVRRIDVSLGYNRIQDRGDGRDTPTTTVIGPNLTAFQTAQTFPVKLQTPQARISFKVNERLRWNLGYQYFGYHESFGFGENYLAHTGYTSLLWSF